MKKRLIILISCMVLAVFFTGKKWIQAQEVGANKKSLLKPKADATDVAEEATKETEATTDKTRGQKVKDKASEVASKIVDQQARTKILDGIKGFGLSLLQDDANKYNTHKTQAGTVRNWEKPSYAEQEFIRNRLAIAGKGQAKFLNLERDLNSSEALKIGAVFSGGGYRSMILTTGYMQAFSDTGLLDSTMYISSLSGSTWFLAPWLLFEPYKTPTQFKQSLIEKINAKRFDIAALQNVFKIDSSLLINDVLWPKFIFDQPISSIELFGGLLSYTLLSDYGNNRQRQHLSSLWTRVRNGTRPFPIFTAVSKEGSELNAPYRWYEFNPLEVRNVEHGLSIDTWAFGRKCDGGKTTDFGPEQTLGTLMGIFGSAYAVNLRDLNRMADEGAEDFEQEAKSQLEKFKGAAISAVLTGVAQEEKIGSFRLWPGTMNNPWLNVPSSLGKDVDEWLTSRQELTLVDGGISFNLPLPPLLDRNLDVIIMADSSGGLREGEGRQRDLALALDYAKRIKGYNYSLYEDLRIVFNSTLSVYKDYGNPEAPVIIYLNYQKDASLFEKMQGIRTKELADTYDLRNFDSLKCANEDYCGTFNFNYTPEQLSQLAAIGEFNVRVNELQLKTILRKIFESKGRSLPIKGMSSSQKPHEPEHETGGF
jgi:phospholipase A2